jgi:hypothetical protein
MLLTTATTTTLMAEDERSFAMTLAKSYVSTENVLLDEIFLSQPQGGPFIIDKTTWIKRSFLHIGVLPSSTLSLYQLTDSQRDGTRYKFGVIDGAHRVSALIELREDYPDLTLPNSFPARIYKDLESFEMMYFSYKLNYWNLLMERAPRRSHE